MRELLAQMTLVRKEAPQVKRGMRRHRWTSIQRGCGSFGAELSNFDMGS